MTASSSLRAAEPASPQQTSQQSQSQPQQATRTTVAEEESRAVKSELRAVVDDSCSSSSPPAVKAGLSSPSGSPTSSLSSSDGALESAPLGLPPRPLSRLSRRESDSASQNGSSASSASLHAAACDDANCASAACAGRAAVSPSLMAELPPSCAARMTPPLCVSDPVSSQEIIVLKVGSASLSADDCSLLHLSNICTLVETICALRKEGFQVILVTSGAVAVGCQRLGLKSRPSRVITKQVVAAIGQSRLMRVYDDLFSAMSQPIAQLLLTRDNLSRRQHYLHALNTFRELLRMGVVPIVNENDTVAVEELRVGDNDTLSARVASLVQAKWLFLLTDVDGLYDKDPRSNPDAKIVHTVGDLSELNVSLGEAGGIGTGGMGTKLVAASIATQAGVHTGIIKSTNLQHIRAMMRGEQVGTHFLPSSHPLSAHKKWIAHGLAPKGGAVILDAGAAAALKENKSLFAKGVPCVAGNWAAGDSVRLLQADETDLARVSAYSSDSESQQSCPHTPRVCPDSLLPSLKPVGVAVVNYSSAELRLLAGHHSSEYASVLGYETQTPEVCNRQNIVLLETPPPAVPNASPAPPALESQSAPPPNVGANNQARKERAQKLKQKQQKANGEARKMCGNAKNQSSIKQQ